MNYSNISKVLLLLAGTLTGTSLFGGGTDAERASMVKDPLLQPDPIVASVRNKAKVEKMNRSEPGIARIPVVKAKNKVSKQALQFGELKSALQGPEGLLHLSDLKKFVVTWPEHELARMWLIRSLVKTGAIDEAMVLLGDPGKWQATDWQVGFWKANVQILAGELEFAKQEIDSTFITEPNNADIWVQRAVLEQESGNHQAAIQLLRIAVKLDPDHALANLNLGYSLEHESNVPEALTAYQNFLTSNNAKLYQLRVPVLDHIGKLAKFVASGQVSTIEPVSLEHTVDTAADVKTR